MKHGDTRFTDKLSDQPPKMERAGWYIDSNEGRVYLFTQAALKEAGGGFDSKRGLDALDAAGWIVEKDHGKKRKAIWLNGRSVSLYWIRPDDQGGDHE